MSATPPTREQVAEPADAVRAGALDGRQREQLVALPADIAWSVQTCVLAEQRYADSPELYQGWLAAFRYPRNRQHWVPR